jgi:flagellar motor switch protein FliN
MDSMADDPLMSQDEIERLLQQTRDLTEPVPAEEAPAARPATVGATATAPAAGRPAGSAPMLSDDGIPRADIEFLLNQAEQALESINAAPGVSPPGASPYDLKELSGAAASTETATLDLIRDVELDLKIELGRTHMYLEDVLKLRKGSVVPLDKLAGDPVDVYVNGRLIARGEVLVLNDNFCVRVAELIVGTSVAG